LSNVLNSEESAFVFSFFRGFVILFPLRDMQVTVHYFAQLRRAAGVASESVAVQPGCTLAQLVQRLAEHHDESFRNLVLDAAGQPQRTLLYAIGDCQAELDAVLRDGDTVTILTPMSGG
jgi:molybdopterin converting factor small subunit